MDGDLGPRDSGWGRPPGYVSSRRRVSASHTQAHVQIAQDDMSRIVICKTRLLLAAGLSAASACKEPTVPPGRPNALVATANTLSLPAGLSVAPVPTFTVLGGDGNPLAGVPVTVTVVEGGGTITGAPAQSLAGPTPVGNWVLGTRAGRNTLQIRVNGLGPRTIVVNGVAGPAAIISAIAGNARRAHAGTTMPERLVLTVTDQHGNPVSGAQVNLSLDTQDASLTPVLLTTNASGNTPPATWRLGLRKRVVTGRASLVSNAAVTAPLKAEYQSDFNIEVRFINAPSAEVQRAFDVAADRISGVLTGDVAEQALVAFDPARCGGPSGPVTETIDDVVIYADVSDIDGPGKILGRAGPCVTRATSRQTVVGTMQFDAADAQNLIGSGRFDAVVMHEMLHVIGVGSLWSARNLLQGPIDQDPRFIGPRGTSECMALGYTSACGIGSVPVENIGGGGTAGSHWRESVFDTELMTGFAEATPNMPLSTMTIGSLEDFGYVIYAGAADAFMSPFLARVPPGATTTEQAMDIILLPTFEVLPAGWTRPFR